MQKGVLVLKVAWLPQDGTVYEDCDLSDDSISEPNRICPSILGCAQLQRRLDMLVEAHNQGLKLNRCGPILSHAYDVEP